MTVSARAEIITRRTYCRPLNDEGTIFETWEQVIDRVIGHQRWLWERALTHNILPNMPLHDVSEDLTEWIRLTQEQEFELEELRQLMLSRKALPSGRCFTGDTKVKLLDGTVRRFDELEKGIIYWAYGCKEDGEIVPVEALFNGITRSEHQYAKIKLDNGKEIKCTIDHPFMLVDGSYKEAKDLVTTDSLMPLYTKLNKDGYELTYNKGKWVKTYKLVKDNQFETFDTPNGQCKVIHHSNFNKKDNTPENLIYMGDQDHFALHSALGKENVKKMNDLIWNHPDYEKFRKEKAKQCGELGKAVWSEDKYEKTRNILKQKSSDRAVKRNKTKEQKQALKNFRNTEKGKNISLNNLEKANKDNYGLKVKLFKQAKHLIALNLDINKENWNSNKLYKNAMGFHVVSKYFDSFEHFKTELKLYNHNIVSVEIIESDKLIDFYDFSVPKTVNFALDAGVFVHNTLWLGGTDVSKTRESSMFNCSHSVIETMYDVVDVFWLLLQGCGIGATAKVGTLNGFRKVIPNIHVIRSRRTAKGGCSTNEESFEDGIWKLSIGDSAEAWAKAVGKLLAGKYKAHTLILDFSQIRPAGERLKGYGWISSGDGPFSEALPKIATIMNRRAGGLLTKLDIIEVLNLLGTVLSSRRSAEIMLMDYDSDEWMDFAQFKSNCYEDGFKHKQQSNNSLVFNHKPSRDELDKIFQMMIDAGGSEPGFFNGQTAKKRAPWFSGTNPCGEILLGNKSFCNLVEIDVGKFVGDSAGLHKATTLIARANYRQTIVDLRDGILQESWHKNNEFLRLCGVGATGIAKRDDMTEYDWKNMKYSAVTAARTMSQELGLEWPKNVTTVKPSGTLGKIMDTYEGVHKPEAMYLFNWVNFSKEDPKLNSLMDAGYNIIPNTSDETGASSLVCIPVNYEGGHFDKVEVTRKDGVTEILDVNTETAIEQLERYKKIQMYYCDQNVSNTIYYKKEEKDVIVEWLLNNWHIYVGVSFLFKQDATISAADLGFNYLPQEYVNKETFYEYFNSLREINWDKTDFESEMTDDGCATGACPIK